MNKKQILVLIIAITLTFTMLIVATGIIFVVKPEFMGFRQKNKPIKIIDTVYVEPTITISEKRLLAFENMQKQKELLSSEKDYFYNKTRCLSDSIIGLHHTFKKFNDSLQKISHILLYSNQAAKSLNDTILKLQNEIKKNSDAINKYKQKIESSEKLFTLKLDTLQKQNLESFAKLYNNTNPTYVARILEQIDERDAAKILKLMQKKKAGKVLEVLTPKQAAAILLLGAGN